MLLDVLKSPPSRRVQLQIPDRLSSIDSAILKSYSANGVLKTSAPYFERYFALPLAEVLKGALLKPAVPRGGDAGARRLVKADFRGADGEIDIARLVDFLRDVPGFQKVMAKIDGAL